MDGLKEKISNKKCKVDVWEQKFKLKYLIIKTLVFGNVIM